MKYPRNYPIPKIVELFESKLTTVENDLRGKTNSYNETKVLLSQNTQKEYLYNHVGATTMSRTSPTSSSSP